MEDIIIDVEVEVKTISKRVLPKDWDYDKSVKKVKQLTYKWKSITVEILNELWIANEKLAIRGGDRRSKDFQSNKCNFENYCNDIGITKVTAYRWLNQYDEKGMKIIENKKSINSKKGEKGEIDKQIKVILKEVKKIEEEIKKEQESPKAKELGKEIVKIDKKKKIKSQELEEEEEEQGKKRDANLGLAKCIEHLSVVNSSMEDLIALWDDLNVGLKKGFTGMFNILKNTVKGDK